MVCRLRVRRSLLAEPYVALPMARNCLKVRPLMTSSSWDLVSFCVHCSARSRISSGLGSRWRALVNEKAVVLSESSRIG